MTSAARQMKIEPGRRFFLSALMMQRPFAFALAVLAVGIPARAQTAQNKDKPAVAADQPSLQPYVIIETSEGEIVLELDAEKAPFMVMNFLDYASSGFYNDTIFHRVVKGRMIHGGGYTRELQLKESGLRDPVVYEGGNGLLHTEGSVAAYRRVDDLNSAQSQFFINSAANDSLDKLKDGSSYTVFGKVVGGMDVVRNIESVEVGFNPALAAGLSPYVPKKPVIIKSVRVKTPLDRAKAEAIAKANAEAAADPVGFRVAQLENECGVKAVETNSGLKFIDCKPGNGAFPMGADTVEINFVGTLVDGKEFQSSKSMGEGPMSLKVDGAIRGLREGLQKMREGGRMIIIVPAKLGFGGDGIPGKVPPGATLFFDVTLESVKHAP